VQEEFIPTKEDKQQVKQLKILQSTEQLVQTKADISTYQKLQKGVGPRKADSSHYKSRLIKVF
jgi:hypothetical protein